jgi:hypothetical protein
MGVSAFEHLASTSGIAVVAFGTESYADICGRFICGGLKNWLGCKKWSLTLLPQDYLWNAVFLFPYFSIFLILFSITMALLTMY